MKWAFGECAWTSVFGSGLDNGPFEVETEAETVGIQDAISLAFTCLIWQVITTFG